ncbi:hypothetical protein SCHIN_v1c07210 [Spiroplasma chinense]|uniref:Transmembrane protein n=1 Tax=Spiroplasma chinense TaxID=216932 RepID=A0A5B9Y5C6_9MOLU|nr:hypothetical protein [Spiroplasma chinense]QEH61916.1 hypothetical protein SCHIN_v1c07210 [Spiroplasma chinense]
MSKVITGIILISFCSALFLSAVIFMTIKLFKLKKLENQRIFKNKTSYIWFYIIVFCLTPLLFCSSLGLGIYSLTLNEESAKEITLAFNIVYLVYVGYILIVILVGEKYYKSMIVVQQNDIYYFVDGTKIAKSQIVGFNNTLRRNVLIINYLSEGRNEVYYIKYHWSLKDWFLEKDN